MSVTAGFGIAETQFSARGHVAVLGGYGNTQLDDRRGEFRGRTGLDLGSRSEFEGSVLRTNAEARVEAPFDDDPRHALRQAYVDWGGGRWTARLGKQVVLWGRADRYNPTDVLTPTHFGYNSIDYQDQRFGAWIASLGAGLNESTSLTFFAVPYFGSSILPQGVRDASPLLSDAALAGPGSRRISYAVRLDAAVPNFDASVTAFQGRSTQPYFVLTADGRPATVNPKMRALGADFSAAVGGVVLRGEVARKVFEIENDWIPGTVARSRTAAALGIDMEVARSTMLLVQGLYARRAEDTPGQPFVVALRDLNDLFAGSAGRQQRGVSGTLSWRNDADTLQLEAAAATWFPNDDRALRLKAGYDLGSAWKLSALGEWFNGRPETVFGALKKNRRALLELRRSF